MNRKSPFYNINIGFKTLNQELGVTEHSRSSFLLDQEYVSCQKVSSSPWLTLDVAAGISILADHFQPVLLSTQNAYLLSKSTQVRISLLSEMKFMTNEP